MAQELFSHTLIQFEQEIVNPFLLSTLNGLSNYIQSNLTVLKWDDSQIAIPLSISVELPPLGNHDNIDIRSEEPVLIVFNLENYPQIAPRVYADRLDFPKSNLAHLYVAKDLKPPAFCLVRGGIDEWYSNKQIKDLVIRIENWFRDAATGELIEDGDQFDPLRLEGYSGTIIYDYDEFSEIVEKDKSVMVNSHFSIGLFIAQIIEDRLSFKLHKIITQENFETSYEEFTKEWQRDDSQSKKRYVFGYLMWGENDQVFGDYSINFPTDWNSFKQFCTDYGLKFELIEEVITKYDPNKFLWIPVICGIKRPKPIIGFSGRVEFINFILKIDTDDVKDDKIVNNVPLKFQRHSQPLTLKKATEISGNTSNLDAFSLIIGCGALGSKVVMHLARSGHTKFLLTDPDNVSPHNLVRHALLADSMGLNKADALKNEIQNIYPYEKLGSLFSSPFKGEFWLAHQLGKGFKYILDFSASNSFFQSLINIQPDKNTKVFRANISDFGNLGILLIEGENRNPRIDDLQVFLYYQCRNNSLISTWLDRELKMDKTVNFTVGVGCNSETIVLSDDIVSIHSAYFSCVIKNQFQKNEKNGSIYLNEILNATFFQNIPHEIKVPQFDILYAQNDSSWQIRFLPGIIEAITKEMSEATPNETGGVFVGSANFKTKTIHVVELIKSPADSEANEICFFRGISGLPEAIQEINTLSGNQLGYIGEWHSHPHGPEGMSCVDSKTVTRFQNEFKNLSSPLPVFLVIVTPNEIIPYVY